MNPLDKAILIAAMYQATLNAAKEWREWTKDSDNPAIPQSIQNCFEQALRRIEKL